MTKKYRLLPALLLASGFLVSCGEDGVVQTSPTWREDRIRTVVSELHKEDEKDCPDPEACADNAVDSYGNKTQIIRRHFPTIGRTASENAALAIVLDNPSLFCVD